MTAQCFRFRQVVRIQYRLLVNHRLGVRARQAAARGVFVLIASCGTVLAQVSAPPLPKRALETYPGAAREQLARAHREAEARPFDSAAVCGLARVQHAWEQWEAAHETYARCQRLAPLLMDGFYLDALVLQRLAKHPAAVWPLKQAVTLAPDYLPARLRLGESLYESGHLTESREAFDRLTREPSTAAAAELGLGRIDAVEGQHERAIMHLQRAIQLFPEFGSAYYALALSYRALGRVEDARSALARHAQFGSRWPAVDDPVRATVRAVRDDAEANLQVGINRAEAGDLAGAIAAHEAALARDASLGKVHENLIKLYGQRGDFAKAGEHYRAVQALGAASSSAHYDYGVLLGMQEHWTLAADAYRRALDLDDGHVQARNNLGQVLERQQQFESAIDQYRQAVMRQPSFRLARFNLGRALLLLGQNDEAIVELTTLAQPEDADTARYVFALSTAHVRAGHRDEGIKWGIEARRLALAYGQQELAAIIDRDLARLK